MQSIEDFMREFFCAHIADEKRISAGGEAFRQKFFTTDYQSKYRAGTVEMLQSEEIVRVSASELEAVVIIVFTQPLAPVGSQRQLSRYHLQLVNGGWLIEDVESECLFCRGRDDQTCGFCHGKHWV